MRSRRALYSNYSDKEFKDLDESTIPPENTTEANVTREQLEHLEVTAGPVVALSPTRLDEGGTQNELGKGYDVRFNTTYESFFQHKSVDKTVVRGRGNRERQWLQFNIKQKQLVSLGLQYDIGEAYYALPIIVNNDQLVTSVRRTLFVDVWHLLAWVLTAQHPVDYFLVEYQPTPPLPNDAPHEYEIRGKFSHRSYRMPVNGGFPYFQIPTKSSGHPAGTNWSHIERLIVRGEPAGVPMSPRIRPPSSLTTDGGENRDTPGWFDLDLPDGLTEEYRQRLIDRYALVVYSNGEAQRQEAQQWIVDRILKRYSRLQQRDFEDGIYIENGMKLSEQDSIADITEGLDEPDYTSRESAIVGMLSSYEGDSSPLQKPLSDLGRIVYNSSLQKEKE
jgi:hypothetical protein